MGNDFLNACATYALDYYLRLGIMDKFLVKIARPANHVVLGKRKEAELTPAEKRRAKAAASKKVSPFGGTPPVVDLNAVIEGEPILAVKPYKPPQSKFSHRYDGRILNVEVISADQDFQPCAPPNCIWIGGTGKLPCGAYCGQCLWEIPDDIRKAYFTLKKAYPEQAEGARKAQLEQYKKWLSTREPEFYTTLEKELSGKVLVCWCRKLDLCHGTILLDKLKELQEATTIKRRLWGAGYEAAEKRASKSV